MGDLEGRLRRSATGASFGSGLMLIVGLAVLGAASFFFYRYGYQEFMPLLTSPKTIVDAAETTLIDQTKAGREYLEGMVKENAPAWAEMASTAMHDNLPMVRQHALTHATTAFDDVLNKGADHSKEIVEKFIEKNQGMIKEGVKKLSSDPKTAEAFVTEIGTVFAKEAEVDIDQLVSQVGGFIDGFNGMMEKTKSDRVRLTNLQAMQREMLMLFKRALLEHTPTKTM
jgi:hypothetical protein